MDDNIKTILKKIRSECVDWIRRDLNNFLWPAVNL
jgi:hypothetical protein